MAPFIILMRSLAFRSAIELLLMFLLLHLNISKQHIRYLFLFKWAQVSSLLEQFSSLPFPPIMTVSSLWINSL